MTTGSYINDPGYEVPSNKILVVPFLNDGNNGYYQEVIQPLRGNPKREWFTSHFYYCLPLTIGNQYGFVIRSTRDFMMTWNGGPLLEDTTITFLNDDNVGKQSIESHFGEGIITVQNCFALKTPPGINLMTIQPPNMYIPGCFALTGVIETDQIRRDFTFNFKITIPNIQILIKKGDPLGAFIPIPRYFVDEFDVESVFDHFDEEFYNNEQKDNQEFNNQRSGSDKEKPHLAGRKYFNGLHAFDQPFLDHQKKMRN